MSNMSKKMTLPFFGLKIMNLLVFFDFEPKKCFLQSVALLRAGHNPCQRREMFVSVSTNNNGSHE